MGDDFGLCGERDSARGAAPLRRASDAVVIDARALWADEEFAAAMGVVETAVRRLTNACRCSCFNLELDHAVRAVGIQPVCSVAQKSFPEGLNFFADRV